MKTGKMVTGTLETRTEERKEDSVLCPAWNRLGKGYVGGNCRIHQGNGYAPRPIHCSEANANNPSYVEKCYNQGNFKG